MSDETTPTTPTIPAAPASTPSNGADLRAQIRALSAERSRLSAELKTAQEATATMRQQLKTQGTRHEQDLHLSGLGITSKRGRRAIRREYSESISELGEGGEVEAPTFSAFCEELKDDPLYGRWFTPAETAKPPATRKPASDPNAGTTTPKAPDSPLDMAGYQARRSKLGRKGALAASLEQLKKQGLIS